MLAAALAAPDLPDVAREPAELVRWPAHGLATGRLRKTPEVIFVAMRIESRVLVAAGDLDARRRRRNRMLAARTQERPAGMRRLAILGPRLRLAAFARTRLKTLEHTRILLHCCAQ